MHTEIPHDITVMVNLHGSRADSTPETYGAVSLDFAYTKNFMIYHSDCIVSAI